MRDPANFGNPPFWAPWPELIECLGNNRVHTNGLSPNMLTTISHRAMATEFAVMLAASDQHLADAALEAMEKLDEIESQLTVYQSESEISRINRDAFDAPVAVSEPVFGLLKRSVEWSVKTAGGFDITAGPLVRAWGFTERKGQKPTVDQIRKTLESVGYQHLRLDDDRRSIRFDRPGMEINLGAIGKGFALDVLAAGLIERGLENFLIHGGGSSVLAWGDQSPGQEKGWAVGLSHPTKPKRRLAGLRLHNQALSTSGTGRQFFHHRGKRYGHVIDPRTGFPAGQWLSLTAVDDHATDAEAASTGLFVRPIDELKTEIHTGNPLPKLIGILPGSRQDDVRVVPMADFDWIDPPQDAATGAAEKHRPGNLGIQ